MLHLNVIGTVKFYLQFLSLSNVTTISPEGDGSEAPFKKTKIYYSLKNRKLCFRIFIDVLRNVSYELQTEIPTHPSRTYFSLKNA